jgi:hypothetical protein
LRARGVAHAAIIGEVVANADSDNGDAILELRA